MQENLVIAIDGTAASGKGTLAKALARKLELAYMDTGALYRLVAVKMLDNAIIAEDEHAAMDFAAMVRRTFNLRDTADPRLRTDEVSRMTSIISAYPRVREEVLGLQRDFAEHPPALPDGSTAKGAVLDGRDIGTVVCPDAPYKFFVTADVEVRARRRFNELQQNGFPVTYDSVLADMRARDERDANRATAPMKAAADAVVLDTTQMGIEEVIAAAMAHVSKAPLF